MMHDCLQITTPVEYNHHGSAPIPKMKRSVPNEHRGGLEGDVGYLFSALAQTARMFRLLLDKNASMLRLADRNC